MLKIAEKRVEKWRKKGVKKWRKIMQNWQFFHVSKKAENHEKSRNRKKSNIIIVILSFWIFEGCIFFCKKSILEGKMA